MTLRMLLPLGAFLLLVACGRSAPLPGDSVAADGAVTLSPPRLSTAPQATEAPGAIESRLYPPELVMEHQGALGIELAQRDGILKEVERGQAEMLHLQWELQGEKEKLLKVLDGEQVDEAKSKEAAARVMDRETRIKSSHLTMLVRVKNLLTGPQQRKLRELRAGSAGGQAPERKTASDAGREGGVLNRGGE